MSLDDFSHLRIPLKDVIKATNNFAKENLIEYEMGCRVYEGKLSGKKLQFISISGQHADVHDAVMFNSLPEHQNFVSLIGFCDEDYNKILVVEHPTRGSLDKHVSSAHLTWSMRVQICLDIASALHCLRMNCQELAKIMNSVTIYLDEKWQAKIPLIKLTLNSMYKNEMSRHAWENNYSYYSSDYYKFYYDSGYKGVMLSSIYLFGVILFELLCGTPAVIYDEEGGKQPLRKLACSHYEKGTLTEIIDPVLKVQMNRDAFTVFSEIAYACLDENKDKRPTISHVEEELQKVGRLQDGFETSELQQVKSIQHMKILLKEIRSATRDFHDDFTIPRGIGKVYKADLHHFNVNKYVAENKIKRVSMEEILEYPKRKSTVAIKSIDGGYGQRTEEQIQTLLYLSHENLVKLVGFCDEDDERIHVVYEYASKGSLDEYIHSQYINYEKYTNNPTRETMRNIFPWVIRLQFCLDAARGLNFLHNGNTKNHTLIHGNIKSSNILISRDGVGMIGDFGLSTNEYSDTHSLTKEYDVYSFGLVLFEVMSGRLSHFKISKDDPELLPDIVKHGFEKKKLNDVIDPMLKQEFDMYSASLIGDRSAESLNIFANIAYECFKKEVELRPTMADIVKELEKAERIHVESLKQRQDDEDNSKVENLKHLKIPFKEIYSATHGFDDSCMIGWGGFGGVYKAELFHVDVRKYVEKKESLVELYGYPRRKSKVALKRREIMSDQGRKEFWKEIDVLSGLNHQNIISLVGFCYECGEMIIIYDYASNGSFNGYIRKNQNLKWEQRLQICIDAAQGLNYLRNHHIIHCDVKSGNILLGGSLEGIIGDVGLSMTISSADSQLIVNPVGTLGYIDPKYLERGILTKQSHMYSFGVVLLEVLCGEFVTRPAKDKFRAILVEKAEQHLASNQVPYQIIGEYLRKHLEDGKFLDSVKTFATITHDCLHSTDGDETHRLTMADVLKGLKKALTVHSIGSKPFSLEEIKSATNHFSKERVIGSGASGKIYKGELSFSKKSIPVAVKRLDRARFYEEGAFLKEVVKLSRYVHENIITLRGFCEEDNENIIIMDHESNTSLDRHLDKSILTWRIRLKISIGAAKGLNYIHSFEEYQNTVHGDIKSSNILLDHDWKACISDFIVSKSHGTLGYLDPEYSSSGATKEADVYAFGVVLFELLSGRLAIHKVEKDSHPTALREIIDAEDGVKDKKDAGDRVKDKKDAGDGVKNTKVVYLAWIAARCYEEKKKNMH